LEGPTATSAGPSNWSLGGFISGRIGGD